MNRFSDPSRQETIRPTKDERKLKRALARQYPSQNIWSVLLWYELVPKAPASAPSPRLLGAAPFGP